MCETFLPLMIGAGIVGSVVLIPLATTPTSAQAPVASVTAPAPTLKTPWGEPDLQGIWTDETDTLLQRPAKYADQAFLTEAQREELDKARSAVLARDGRAQWSSETDVTNGYSTVFLSVKPHLPASIRQWYGDSRGRWEGNTLVIDVTNFSPKTDFQGSRGTCT